ncbi:MAG: adenylosuccinate lyase [Proteobacteria bacterium]|nr:adenylosuccinate lyase [Pseudomonadota bacterium]
MVAGKSSDRLWSVSALDGRYSADVEVLRPFVSEGALIRARLRIEASWLLHLARIKDLSGEIRLSDTTKVTLQEIWQGDISDEMVSGIKAIEHQTNHDVKAVEYGLRSLLENSGALPNVLAWVHFACTSEDINNLSYALILQEVRRTVLVPMMDQLIGAVKSLALAHKDLGMMSRTHGQTATPTTLGKEMAVFVRRLRRQRHRLDRQVIEGKINGAVGNFNAHLVAFPQIDWITQSRLFVESTLGLAWNPLTTQIEPHDTFVEYMDVLRLFNVILLDFCRDMWGYISLGYFAQKTVAGEVGSSTMPHKVNPIYFENSEGNIGVANSLLAHFSEKLPVSRFQRDLSDSTVMRVTGTALGHTVLAWKSALKGISRVEVDPEAIGLDLADSWEVLGEAVQTVMRRYGVVDAYERLKNATRGHPKVTCEMIHLLIQDCAEIPGPEKAILMALTPSKYVGLASKLVADFIDL